MNLTQFLLTKFRTYILWRISHNKIVRYLNSQQFSISVTNNSGSDIATANTINVVNDIINTFNSVLDTANTEIYNSIILLANTRDQNNTSWEFYNLSNNLIEAQKPETELSVSKIGTRFNVVSEISNTELIHFGSRIYFHDANTPNTIEYSFDEGHNFGFDVLDYWQPAILYSNSYLTINRKTKIQNELIASDLEITNIDGEILLNSNGNNLGKKSEWLNIIGTKEYMVTANGVSTPVFVMNGDTNNSISILTSPPRKWTKTSFELQLHVSGADAGNAASLLITNGSISNDVVPDITTDETPVVAEVGSIANTVVSTEIINISTNSSNDDILLINIQRIPGDSNDTLIGNLNIHGAKIFYNTEKLSDD